MQRALSNYTLRFKILTLIGRKNITSTLEYTPTADNPADQPIRPWQFGKFPILSHSMAEKNGRPTESESGNFQKDVYRPMTIEAVDYRFGKMKLIVPTENVDMWQIKTISTKKLNVKTIRTKKPNVKTFIESVPKEQSSL